MVGQIIGGDYGEIWIRQKSDEKIEIGELLVADGILLQIFDLEYGSLLENRDIARMSGMQLEEVGEMEIYEKNIRNYILAKAKPLFDLKKEKVPKYLPGFFKRLRRVNKEDLKFIDKGENGVYLGKVRSGSESIDVPFYLNGKEVLEHHVLIPATTGRGKSNLVKVMLWNIIGREYAGILVLDAHDEYYSYSLRGKRYGLKEHPKARKNVIYYSVNPGGGERHLMINIKNVKPWHLREIVEFSQTQEEALYVYHKKYGEMWIHRILSIDEPEKGIKIDTLAALQRKIKVALELKVANGEIIPEGKVFGVSGGERTIRDIVDELEDGKIVIVDTSTISQNLEILIASMIMNEAFRRYKNYKEQGELENKPVISVVIEEAPRVLGGDKSNIFKTIAREGRKFKIGIVAITQLASLIPREILANLNTKIILGNEMKSERDAVISSSPQDLSKDSKMIASLDKGEAIVSSIFTKFAVPIKIDKFEDIVDREREREDKQMRLVDPML